MSMTAYKKLKLTHATLGRPVHIILGTVAGYHWSETTGSTHVYTPAGVFPAKESVEEIDGLIDQLTKQGENK